MWPFRLKNAIYLSWEDYIREMHKRRYSLFQHIATKKSLKNTNKKNREDNNMIDEATIKKVFSELLRGLPTSGGVKYEQ